MWDCSDVSRGESGKDKGWAKKPQSSLAEIMTDLWVICTGFEVTQTCLCISSPTERVSLDELVQSTDLDQFSSTARSRELISA